MRLSLAAKIFLGFAVVVGTFGALSIFSLLTLHDVGDEIRIVNLIYLPLTGDAAKIDAEHTNRKNELKGILDEKDSGTLRQRIRSARVYHPDDMQRAIQNAWKLAQDKHDESVARPSDRDYLEALSKRFRDLQARYASYDQKAGALFDLLETESPDPKAVTQTRGELLALEQKVDGDIKLLVEGLKERVDGEVNAASSEGQHRALAIIALTVAAIILGLLVTIALFGVLSPIRRLTEGAVRIRGGDYSAVAPAETNDEVGVLAREFNAMAASLRAERLAAIGRVTAQITHEIRNPLSSIGLNAEMLEDALSQAHFSQADQLRESQELLSAISREVDRLTEVTERYLRFARLPKPQVAVEDVGALTTSLLDFVAEEMDRAGIRVVRDLGGPAWAAVDEGQLRQALLNLLRNAREAQEGRPGRIQVSLATGNGRVALAVEDDGPGISAENLPRIFDPFFSTKTRGTGLGLAVTQQIVREHGGDLTCEAAPQGGTRFVITLPSVPAAIRELEHRTG